MDTNEPGREPTETKWEKVSGVNAGISWALSFAVSGQRPMPDTPAPDEQDATLVKLIDLLTRTANAVKGQPGEMKQHGWADLPELCTALTARVAGLEAALRMFLEAGLGNSTDVVQQRAAVFNAAKLLTAPTHTAPGGEGGGK